MNKHFSVHSISLVAFQIAKNVVFDSLIQIYNYLLGQDLFTFSFCHTGNCSQEEKIVIVKKRNLKIQHNIKTLNKIFPLPDKLDLYSLA